MSQKYFCKIHTSGFTLVELIVVITILAILGTIGFVQLGGFAGSARDSVRISNLTNLKKGLDMFQIKSWVYPLPENPVNITASGTIIGYQGFVKEQVEWIAKLSLGATKDPSDATIYTTYSTNANQTKMQVMVFLEESSSIVSFVPSLITEAHASVTSDYSKRFPTTMGDSLGILLGNSGSTLNQPVQESGTGVDVVNTSTGYVAVFSNTDTLSWSGTKLVAMKSSMTSPSSLPTRDTSLVGYWDMETTVWSGLLADLSGNGNNGMGSGGGVIGGINGTGKSGKATSFNGVDNYVNIWTIKIADTTSWVLWFKSTTIEQNGAFISNYLWTALDRPVLELDTGWLRVGHFWPGLDFNTIMKPSINEWHHIVMIHDLNQIIAYIDWKKYGSLVRSSSILSGNYNLYFGIRTPGWYNFSWVLDEVRIYNRALSDSEIKTLYNVTK